MEDEAQFTCFDCYFRDNVAPFAGSALMNTALGQVRFESSVIYMSPPSGTSTEIVAISSIKLDSEPNSALLIKCCMTTFSAS